MSFKTKEEMIAFYNNLPKKIVGAGVLVFREEEVLLLKPSYKES